MPAEAGIREDFVIQQNCYWIPAFAGMTTLFPNYGIISKAG